MTKETLLKSAQKNIGGFTPNEQELILVRATGRKVVAWDLLTVGELNNIIGACAVARVLFY